VIPLADAEEDVLEHVPPEVKLTVTTSPKKGLEPTLELAERLARHGYAVVPHLAARHIRDGSHLVELVERMRSSGASDVLVMAGDAAEPAGEFAGSVPLLRALDELGRPFPEVGITGYPESHAFIPDPATIKSMSEKEEFATYIVSQICFDPQVTAGWAAAVWQRGTRLPLQVGVPGVVPRSKLLRVSERIGVGDSIRILRGEEGPAEHPLDGDYDPHELLLGLQESFGQPQPNVAGFHIFTFNELADTERWRQAALAHASR
jgi:methylenetetrahydrofolate reductase (NADPH)